MADIGNRGSSMRLQCKPCGWVPPEDTTMEAVQLHFQVDHYTDEVTLDLMPVCTCGEAMAFTHSRPTGGGAKDWFRCGVCGSTGYVRRNPAREEGGHA